MTLSPEAQERRRAYDRARSTYRPRNDEAKAKRRENYQWQRVHALYVDLVVDVKLGMSLAQRRARTGL